MATLTAAWALLALAGRLAGAGPVVDRDAAKCNANTFSKALTPNAQILNVNYVPEGGSFGEGPVLDALYPTNPTNLPQLCAVTILVTTSPSSYYRFGLFLPSRPHQWKQRFFAVGNGGFGGGINWLDMASGSHYGMASISTDTGHNSSATDATWALNNEEMRIDWGWRALHGSVQLGKKMTEAFYGQKIKYSYYSGCSTGGRMGLREIQSSPDSFDGALIGAPSWIPKIMNPYCVRIGKYNLPVGGANHVLPEQFNMLGQAVIAQCDALDGVKDGIVSSPELCAFDFSKITCGNSAANASNCLTAPQVQTCKSFYGDYVSDRGEFLFSGITLSSEDQWYILMGDSSPSAFGTGYVQDYLYNNASWDWTTFTDQVVYDAIQRDPGQASAANFDISPFRDRGGKIVMYHGLSDGLVATKGSQLYYNRTIQAMGGPVKSWFRYFEIPGMQHCAGTTVNAPWCIAGEFQAGAMSPDGWSVPGFRDSNHDAMLALVDWVERGRAVDSIIATTWNSPYVPATGVLRQRPICPYPQKARYNNRGSVDHASSWKCA